jgi:hypothetical protein
MTTSRSKAKGSAFEREVAREFGLKRTPGSGAMGGGDLTAPTDSIWGGFSWEAKRLKALPKFFGHALDQAQSDIAIGDPRIPIVATREDGGRMVLVCYAHDLRLWAEALAEVGQAGKNDSKETAKAYDKACEAYEKAREAYAKAREEEEA